MAKLKLVNCSVIDALDSRPRPSAEVHIIDDRIEWAGPASRAPEFSGSRAVDLEGGYLLPGLIESHVHLFLPVSPQMPYPKAENAPKMTMYCAQHAVSALKGGWTGMRCVGDGYGIDVAVRDAFKAGVILGPRLWVSGPALIPTAGHCADREEMQWSLEVCDGVDGWRKAARYRVQIGADMIKVIPTGGALGHDMDVTTALTMTEEELLAAAQVARSRERPLVVHCSTGEAIVMSVRAGARTIEHGYYNTKEAVDLLVSTGTYLTPTLSATHLIPSQCTDDYERAGYAANQRPPWKVKRAEDRLEPHTASFKMALQAGVKMLVGADFGPWPIAGHIELLFLVREGMSPWQAIVSATYNAADAVGQLNNLGTVEAGKYADLIAVAGNPLEDIRYLREPKLVLRGGQAAVNEFAGR